MKGSESKLLSLMEGADRRFIIPVYQRKYDWKKENCERLYSDLVRITEEHIPTHFFGSIVSSGVVLGNRIEFHIIDGQQRLTTVSLLLLALCNLLDEKQVEAEEGNLSEQIRERFLIDKWAKADDKIKLVPVRSDRDALRRLYDKDDYDESSNMTINYRYFYSRILKKELSADEIYRAVSKLEIISITLDNGDNAQRIFESLNSTGVALSEGDKIRNYVLMGLDSEKQAEYYTSYWEKIEKCTKKDVSGFVRDYLSVKQQATPNISSVYPAFKAYAEDSRLEIESILIDLTRYAKLYEKILTCHSDLGEPRLDDCLYRMMRLEVIVTRPFFLEVLRLNQDGKVSTKDVLEIFSTIENYLFRRNICDVPTNALNKIFVNLNKEILRYDNTADNYVEKLKYALISKKESGRFPDDTEFIEQLGSKQVYNMRGRYKAYLFERFENFGTIEAKDVYTHLDNNVYSIEHIMPQTLTPEWAESLGIDFAEIHSKWLHRLANLTLTGYNPSLSNKSFIEKRDAKIGGYSISGLRMNQSIAKQDRWGEKELIERNNDMVQQALEIWKYPETNFVPAEKEYDSCSLDDENYELTGRDIIRYSYQTIEQTVSSWTDMFEHVVKYFYQKDPAVISALAFGESDATELGNYFSNREEDLRSSLKIDDGIYAEKNTSTAMKASILRRLLPLYGADPMDLVFYLKDSSSDHEQEGNRRELRLKYWTYALPIIIERNSHRGSFGKANPSTSNWISGFFGIGGFSISCAANYDCARVDFYMGSGREGKNKEAFDYLYQHREEIEDSLGVSLQWNRADTNKASWITYTLNDVSITDENDWPRMAEFHAEWSNALCDELLPYLRDHFDSESINDSEIDAKLNQIAAIIRNWASNREDIQVNLDKCNRKYTRFTTERMSRILPDIPGHLSGWGTQNHYFYEVINRNGDALHIKLAVSGKNKTDDFIRRTDWLNRLYPSPSDKADWRWRTPFKTNSVAIKDPISEEQIQHALDSLMPAIHEFEEDLEKRFSVWDKEFSDNTTVHLEINKDDMDSTYENNFSGLSFDAVLHRINRSDADDETKKELLEILFEEIEFLNFEGFEQYGKNKQLFMNDSIRNVVADIGKVIYKNYIQAILAADRGDVETCHSAFEKMINDDSYIADECAFYQLHMGAIKDSVPGFYKWYLSVVPENKTVPVVRAICEVLDDYYTQDTDKGRIDLLSKVTEQFPDSIICNTLLGYAYYSSKQWDNAIECLEKVVRENWYCFYRWYDTLFRLGYAYSKKKNREKSIECYKEVISIMPEDGMTYNNLAYELYLVGRHEESLEMYRQCLSIDPENNYAVNNIVRPMAALHLKDELRAYINDPNKKLWKEMINIAEKALKEEA